MTAKNNKQSQVSHPCDRAGILSDPVDDWIADHSEEWSCQYPGKHLAIVDFQLVGAFDDFDAAYDKAGDLYPSGELTVFYVPRKEELVMLL